MLPYVTFLYSYVTFCRLVGFSSLCCIRGGSGGERIVDVVPGGTDLEPLVRFRRRDRQTARTRNNHRVKSAAVCYMWRVWVTRRRGFRSQKSNAVGWKVRLNWTTSRARMCVLVRKNIHKIKGRGLDPCVARGRTTWHPVTRCTSARTQFELH